MRGRRGTAGLLVLGLLGLGSGLSSCGTGGESKPEGPSARQREGRSEVLRGLMASKERVDPNALKATGEEARGATVPETPDGTGGSGRPQAHGWAAGRVSWVGDNEVLFVDGQGEEREVWVEEGTQLRRDGQSAELRDMKEGDELRVTYEARDEGWIARDLEVVPARKAFEPEPQSVPLR
ncbi:hypothetical protein [Corallococcus llansteffanensis]|uniref:DUF5666 domain-containing protein n=1 Tax=Corallococcus llansteffanensis TaxID=2316731 RepID=A0A3A8QF35_9BACT|nr:hypothetical protein [Corallococcus llansteffanensis]RKH63472.1 hypothetical protein D7V93_08695 [Corallococcus llansteffanensis]